MPQRLSAAPNRLARPDQLAVPSVGLYTRVANYVDCNAATPVTHASAARDWCAPNTVTYLLGHNPGVFTRLLGVKVGDQVLYTGPAAKTIVYAITDIRLMAESDAEEQYLNDLSPHLTLQTCAVPDGSEVWIFRAIAL